MRKCFHCFCPETSSLGVKGFCCTPLYFFFPVFIVPSLSLFFFKAKRNNLSWLQQFSFLDTWNKCTKFRLIVLFVECPVFSHYPKMPSKNLQCLAISNPWTMSSVTISRETWHLATGLFVFLWNSPSSSILFFLAFFWRVHPLWWCFPCQDDGWCEKMFQLNIALNKAN